MRSIRDPDDALDPITTIPHLLRVLKTRTTSWTRDRMLIAGLMCLSPRELDVNMTGPQVTRQLLLKFGSIQVADLIHGEVPISTIGPWNWCPQSIFDFGHFFHFSSDDECYIEESGLLWGRFTAHEILPDDAILPCGSHPAQAARVSAALSNRANCLLLTTSYLQKQSLYILFQPIYVEYMTIRGHWIGCVSHQGALRKKGSQAQQPKRRAQRNLLILFGEHSSLNGHLLPTLHVRTVMRTLEAFRQVIYAGSKLRWFLSDGFIQSDTRVGFHYSNSLSVKTEVLILTLISRCLAIGSPNRFTSMILMLSH